MSFDEQRMFTRMKGELEALQDQLSYWKAKAEKLERTMDEIERYGDRILSLKCETWDDDQRWEIVVSRWSSEERKWFGKSSPTTYRGDTLLEAIEEVNKSPLM